MENLSGDMSLRALAARSGYSLWHFQRFFFKETGITPALYIRQMRVEKTAYDLVILKIKFAIFHYVMVLTHSSLLPVHL
ncbi:AraC family transcriptional regulator [Klebsiella pneumoniae]